MIRITRAVPLAALATAVLLSAACKKTPETVPTPVGPVVGPDNAGPVGPVVGPDNVPEPNQVPA